MLHSARKGAKSRPVGQSRLTSKGQATIPMAVRERLSLSPGDAVLFEESAHGGISIRRGEPLDLEFLRALEKSLTEWNSDNDDEAFGDL
ncbi:MAG: AbrB/MazE/SpoVT family DNA-binding domain-containing protein [Candidatus Binataceae bacterium]